MSTPARFRSCASKASIRQTKRHAQASPRQKAPFWIVADQQTRGRGRSERRWARRRQPIYDACDETGVSAAAATSFPSSRDLPPMKPRRASSRRAAPVLAIEMAERRDARGSETRRHPARKLRRPKGKRLAVILGVGITSRTRKRNGAPGQVSGSCRRRPGVFPSLAPAFETAHPVERGPPLSRPSAKPGSPARSR